MKYNGIKLEAPKPKVLVIPRDGVDIVFKAKLIPNYEKFDELVPAPVPVKVKKANGSVTTDFNDKGYIAEVTRRDTLRAYWIFIESLSATDGLTWDLVDPNDPETWDQFTKEFEAAGFTPPVIERIKMLCYSACGLDQSMIDEATERFLAGVEG